MMNAGRWSWGRRNGVCRRYIYSETNGRLQCWISERTKSPREVHLSLFIYRNNPLFLSWMCFIMAPIWASFVIGAFKNNICICISIQNYQKVNNIANCGIQSLLLKKASPKTIVVSWQQISFRQKLKYVHLQPMNVYGKNSIVKGVNINVDRLYNSAWCCPSNGYSI